MRVASLAVCLLPALAPLVRAIPSMDTMFRQTSMFVPGQDVIRVRPTTGDGSEDLVLRSSEGPGMDGNAIITDIGGSWAHSPPLFYINPANSRLMLFVNSTTLLHVNVINSTETRAVFQVFDKGGEQIPLTSLQIPLRISFSTKQQGIKGGIWSYLGTLLVYDLPASLTKGQGAQTNQGVFFQCAGGGKSFLPGLYTTLDPSVVPSGCMVVTLHSMGAPDHKHGQHKEL